MNIEEIIRFVKSLVWGQILPWLGIIWTLVIFFGWGKRKMQRENEKLRLEIEKLKKEDARIYLSTTDEIKAVLSKTNQFLSEVDKINRGKVLLETFEIGWLRHGLVPYLEEILERYSEIMEGKIKIKDPEQHYETWIIVRSDKRYEDKLGAAVIKQIDLLLSLLIKARATNVHTSRA